MRELLLTLQDEGEANITVENIAVQRDVGFTSVMDSKVEDLMNSFKLVGTPKGVEASKFKELNDGLLELSNILTDRFGLPIKLLHSDGLAYVLPLTGTNGSVLDVKREDIVNVVRNMEKDSCPKGDCDSIDLVNETNDTTLMMDRNIVNKLSNDMKVMNSLFANGSVSFDNVEAKISGLLEVAKSKKIYTPIGINIGELIRYGATNRHIVSIILHEVGHQYTYISYANSYTNTVITPLESLTDNSLSKTKKRKIIIKEFGDLIDDETTLPDLPDIIIKRIMGDGDKDISFFNSEILADQFSARFGYGEEVVMVLNNFGYVSERESPILNILFILAGIALTVLIVMSTTTLYGFLLTLQLAPAIIGIIIINVYGLLANSLGLNTIDEHEQSHARTRRMKLELIRMLRTNDYPKDIESLIKDIVSLDNYLERTKENKAFSSLLSSWVLGKSKEIGKHEHYQRIEQLMENDLHVSVRMNRNKKILKD